jgi:SPP1 gp7 family putative phage head morphogenesis protein
MPKEPIINKIKRGLGFEQRKVPSAEIGGSGTPIFSGSIDTGEYVSDLKGDALIDTVNQMRWSDASVRLALLTVTLPILSADWDIQSASEDRADEEVAEFVKYALFEKLDWSDVLRQSLLMLPFGHYVFEKVFTMEDDKILFKKWVARLPKTITKWNTEKGELKSILQTYYTEHKQHEVEIPAEKLIVLTYQKEGDNYLGTSILRQAYKHWFFRDNYYKIDAIATERHGVGIPIIYLPENYTETDKQEAEEIGRNLRANEQAYIVFPSKHWGIEMLDMKTSSIKNPKEMLDHHTREILKSVLAQFMDLGASGVGSYALSKDQSRFFMDSMDALAKDIQGAIGEQAIKQLVDLNFTVKEYPKLVHGDLGSVDIGELASAIQTLSFVGTITPDTELEKYLRTIMKLPDMAEETERERERPKEPKQKDIEEEPEEPKQMSENTRWRRDLTKPELRVRFEEIEDMMDYEEARLHKELSKILLKEKAYLLPIFERAVREGDLATLQSVAGKFTGEYERVFRNGIKKIFEFGKSKASFEIGEAPPQTAPEMSAELQDKAHYYAQRGYEDLVKVLTASASVAILKNLPEKEGVKEVSKAFNSYLTKNAKAAANLIISENLNEGRKYAFDTYKENVYAYQWSAILDGGTCNYCQSMDGRTISATDQRYEEYQPGRVHFNCRCIWVAILKDEEPAPIFTGIPDSLQPQTRIPPWDFEDLSRPLADAVPIDVEERLYAHEEEPHGNH